MEQRMSWCHGETRTLLDPLSVINIPKTVTTRFSIPCSVENMQEPVFYSVKLDDPVSPPGMTLSSAQTSGMWSSNPTGRRKDRPTCSWSKKEVVALLTHWANPAVQQELQRNVRNNAVYNSLSAKMASLGYYKTAQKCKEKLKKLKQDYRRIKNSNHLDGGKNIWFDVIDQILGSQPAASTCSETATSPDPNQPVRSDLKPEESSFVTKTCETCTVSDPTACPTEILKEPDVYLIKVGDSDTPSTSSAASSTMQTSDVWSASPVEKRKYVHTCSWSKKEVHALLAYWANPAVQQELQRNVRNNAVYNNLSAKLASLGFNKSAQKCKEKIKKLKQDYRRIKKSQHNGWSRTAWFGILDEVLGSQSAARKYSETPKSSQVVELETELPTGESEWSPDEVQVLVTLWAQSNIQKQLRSSGKNGEIFTYLSNELALVGFNKTPQQCSFKVNQLKEEYQKIKQTEPHENVGSDWFAIIDSVLCPDGETSKDTNSPAARIEPKSPEDSSQAAWTSDEVDVLLTRWADQSVQEELQSAEAERVYAQLSSELATQGFDKTTNQCRTKIKLLIKDYERIMEQKDTQEHKSSWFVIMDKMYSCTKPKIETPPAAEISQSETAALQHDLPEPAEGYTLSIPSLCLLVPTLRLMCAFAWQVVQCRNVLHYRKVEELVVMVTELAPDLLTDRERVQLLLRLRARLVLELCRRKSTANLLNIQPHLKIIRDLKMSCSQEDMEELEKSKSNFVQVVHTLIKDEEERERFFTEVFPVHYGQQYETTLQTLVWKFISRLDNLLPIPDIKQTAEWLSSAPSVMEECGQLVLEQEQLKELLHFHEQQTGNINKSFSQTQNMFLPTLSLHPKTDSEHRVFSTADYSTEKEPSEEPVKDSEKTDLKAFQLHRCSMCSYSDSHVSSLLQHIRQEHLIPESHPFEEAEDDDFFSNVGAPTNSSEVRKDADISDNQGSPFECDKKYYSKSSLIVHHQIHTGETPFLCSICGQGFRSSSHLESHAQTHAVDRRFKYHICGKTSIQHLSRHMHRGEKNYLCTECGKAFLSLGELQLHMRYHAGERPYMCKHCGKGFITKCLLTVHTRRHTGESPYRSSLCPKSFPTLRTQKKHLKVHTDRKSYPCLECGKTFRQEDNFKLHVETHDLV